MQTFFDVTLKLLTGFTSSVLLFALTLIFALPLGLLISFCSMSKFKPIKYTSKVIVWVLRGTPLMLQIFVFFFVPGLLFDFVWPTMNTGWAWFDKTISSRFLAALVAFIINYAAYFSEIFRGGIESIPKGQTEAGKVLGMNRGQIVRHIILLQVIKRVLAPMSNEVMTLIKDTSLAQVIIVQEILYHSQELLIDGLVWPIFYAGAFYLIFVGILTLLFGYFEKKLSYYKV